MTLESVGLWAKGLDNPPEFCGPDELGRIALQLQRLAYPEESMAIFRGPLSSAAFTRQLNLVHHASMMLDEGRLSRFVIVNKGEKVFWTITNLDVPLREPAALRRLAQTCIESDHALWIKESPGNHLSCAGLVTLDPMVRPPGVASPVPLSHGISFEIRVHGPGHLELGPIGLTRLELKHGSLRPLGHWYNIPDLHDLAYEAAQRIQQATETGFDPTDGRTFHQAGNIAMSLRDAMSRILRRMVLRRHGGCLAIIPDAFLSRLPEVVALKYRSAGLDLSLAASEFWKARIQRFNPREPGEELEWRESLTERRLFEAADAIDRASCVDGCVVLDRRLEMRGFGGEIRVQEGDSALRERPLISSTGEQPMSTDDAMNLVGGTRHRSALRLCMKVEGAICFVVSQDGELKVFLSRRHETRGFVDVAS